MLTSDNEVKTTIRECLVYISENYFHCPDEVIDEIVLFCEANNVNFLKEYAFYFSIGRKTKLDRLDFSIFEIIKSDNVILYDWFSKFHLFMNGYVEGHVDGFDTGMEVSDGANRIKIEKMKEEQRELSYISFLLGRGRYE